MINFARVHHDSADFDYDRTQNPTISQVGQCFAIPAQQSFGQEKVTLQLDQVDIRQQEKLPGDGFFDCWVVTSTDGSRVLVKSISENSPISDLNIFQKVAIVLSSLPRHSNIAGILGIERNSVPYFIFQEFVEGGTLREYLLKNYKSSGYLQRFDESGTAVGITADIQDLSNLVIGIADGMKFLVENKVGESICLLPSIYHS
ncbi:hypothetical protein HOLleu_32837 [Holothuria leucospilota]|uniref:Protein kinase domain-containing protein n=1 Tax=Holothuria leucospilota TaxID=206669 RepID=A0A9Q1BJ91_HOLLE|nr:hypothetical protein HOLleu_32837 [Holothuria leucospilota]